MEAKTVGFILYGSAGGGPAEVRDDGQLLFHTGEATVFETLEDAMDAFAHYVSRAHYSGTKRVPYSITIRRQLAVTSTIVTLSDEAID